jgi:CheY-like chemotaxis protein
MTRHQFNAPAIAGSVAAGLSQDDSALTALEGSKILVVEDEAIIATDIGFALEDIGAEVVGPAGTLPEALSLARKTPELSGAILDVNLAGESVFRLAEHLVSRAVPVIFHTGCELVDELEKRFPDADFLIKPVAIEDLLWRLADRVT